MVNISLKTIKLIIWDLDDTFWRGTLSEGGIEAIPENIKLVKDLTDRGIINSICSKNDLAPVIDKLKEFDVDNYFVFNSIDWTPKGERVGTIISEMGLRPVNVLFIDDNVVNLNEAAFYSKDLVIAEPPVLEDLIRQVQNMPVNDINHTRLKNYKILEQKRDSKATYSDNESFLYSTNTRVEIKNDCINQIDRIHELIMRTNQLNFTKNRMSKHELEALLNDKDIDSGYVHVSDKFGDYGIVGFFAIKEGECIHFLFSCRTIGQGVEQYVYSILNFPKLNVVGNVISSVKVLPPPKWINMEQTKAIKHSASQLCREGLIIFKGACDLSIMTSFLDSNISMKEEFTYVGNRGNEIEHHNHSVNYTTMPFLTDSEKKSLLDDCIFNDTQIFETSIYDPNVRLIFISSLIEANLGVYRKKGSNIKIAFAEWSNPLTSPQKWNEYINKKVHDYSNTFTEKWFADFTEKYEYLGRITPEEYIENLNFLLEKIAPEAKICIMLGCEKPYDGNKSEAYVNREIYHIEMNKAIRSFAENNERVYTIDWTDLVESQDDFTDNINHYQRRVYYKASVLAQTIIKEVLGVNVKGINPVKRYLNYLGQKYTNDINRNSWYYPYIRDIFHWLADKKRVKG